MLRTFRNNFPRTFKNACLKCRGYGFHDDVHVSVNSVWRRKHLLTRHQLHEEVSTPWCQRRQCLTKLHIRSGGRSSASLETLSRRQRLFLGTRTGTAIASRPQTSQRMTNWDIFCEHSSPGVSVLPGIHTRTTRQQRDSHHAACDFLGRTKPCGQLYEETLQRVSSHRKITNAINISIF